MKALAEAVHAKFIAEKLTLSVAESCTGGRLAAALTRIPGASEFFLGSVVAYSNFLKVRLLNVSEQFLNKHGPVSQAVVEAMAKGIQKISGSDYALAVTGIAGPEGGNTEIPVGTVWICCLDKWGKVHTQQLRLDGERDEIMEKSVSALLAELLRR
jgi:PncC family amidohydrolase